MADGVLDFRGKFPEGAALAVGQEDRVVTESRGAPRRIDDHSAHLTFEGFDHFAVDRDRDHADEPGAAVLHPLEFGEQLGDPLRIGRRVARRMDSGASAERLDFQSGVVGESGQIAVFAGGQRLDRSVFGEGRAVLLDPGESRIICERLQFDLLPGEQFTIFGDLVLIPGGDDDVSHNASLSVLVDPRHWRRKSRFWKTAVDKI